MTEIGELGQAAAKLLQGVHALDASWSG
jgi:hypothetical protein